MCQREAGPQQELFVVFHFRLFLPGRAFHCPSWASQYARVGTTREDARVEKPGPLNPVTVRSIFRGDVVGNQPVSVVRVVVAVGLPGYRWLPSTTARWCQRDPHPMFPTLSTIWTEGLS